MDILKANITVSFISSLDTDVLVSDTTMAWFKLINYVVLCNIVALFGLAANVINLVIFVKQGFHNTINISLCGIAVSDFCGLLFLLCFNVCMNPLFANSDLPIMALEIQYLTAGWPFACFGRITSWITAYVTAERCPCITVPLKVKIIITPTRTAVILCLIYALNIAGLTPEYVTAYYGWKFHPERNKTLLGLMFRGDRVTMQRLSFSLHAALFAVAFVADILFTLLLVIKLKQKSKWRAASAYQFQNADIISNRHKNTVKMTVLLSVVLIVLCTPTMVCGLVTFIEPRISVTGKYSNAFVVLGSFAFLCDAINSSINIFLYYRMSSKYRRTFKRLFAII